MKTIPLTRGYEAIVDDDDYEKLSQYKWQACISRKLVYARRSLGKINGYWKQETMHRVIIDVPENMQVDHKNHNTLDNRKENLRIATPAENMRNMRNRKEGAKYKGVHWLEKDKKWSARIRVFGKTRNIGNFESDIEAGRAYDLAAIVAFEEFAYTNFPVESYSYQEIQQMRKHLIVMTNRKKSSQYKGVYLDKQDNHWYAYTIIKGDILSLGKYENEENAAKAVDVFKKFNGNLQYIGQLSDWLRRHTNLMKTRRIDGGGRISLPNEIRKVLRIEEGDIMEVFSEGDQIILRKICIRAYFCEG